MVRLLLHSNHTTTWYAYYDTASLLWHCTHTTTWYAYHYMVSLQWHGKDPLDGTDRRDIERYSSAATAIHIIFTHIYRLVNAPASASRYQTNKLLSTAIRIITGNVTQRVSFVTNKHEPTTTSIQLLVTSVSKTFQKNQQVRGVNKQKPITNSNKK